MRNDGGGGAAFPHPREVSPNGEEYAWAEPGMTLRDYFAAKALQGWLSTYSDQIEHPADRPDANLYLSNIAAAAYAVSDAMLVERAKP